MTVSSHPWGCFGSKFVMSVSVSNTFFGFPRTVAPYVTITRSNGMQLQYTAQ